MTSCVERMDFAPPKRTLSRNRVKASLFITFIYIAVSSMWIVGTDYLMNLYFTTYQIEPRQQQLMNSAKGFVFLVSTGILLYFLVSRSFKHADDIEQKLSLTLAQTSEQYRNLFEKNPLPMLVYDQRSLRILAVNDAAEQHYGYSAEEWLSKTIADLHPEVEVARINQNYADINSNSQRVSMWQHRRKDGSTIVVEIHSRPIIFDGNNARLTLIRDLTLQREHEARVTDIQLTLERRVAERTTELEAANARLRQQMHEREVIERELNAAKDAAEHANAAKSVFLASTSHEIRTPLTSILGYADLLLEDISAEDRLNYARIIRQNAAHLYGLIRDVMDLSRLEAGKIVVNPVKCSPVAILAEVDSLMRPRADELGVRLRVDPVGQMPDNIITDPVRLRQILLNLISNSLKFSPAGEVTLTARYHAPAPQSRPMLEMRIADTGVGMSEDQLQKIFQPFYQIQNAEKPRAEGFGLGLAIAKQLCEMLGGEINVQSTPGKGSVFTVRISAESPPAELTPPTPESTIPARNIRLKGSALLVEDNPNIRKLVSLYLETAGIHVHAVGTGLAGRSCALEALKLGQPYDVILMDMNLPDMNGSDVTRELRRADYSRPIIALTAHSLDSDRQRMIDLGCNDVVPKPIDRKKFLLTLQHYLPNVEITVTPPQSQAIADQKKNK